MQKAVQTTVGSKIAKPIFQKWAIPGLQLLRLDSLPILV